jgi:hypothetical protein
VSTDIDRKGCLRRVSLFSYLTKSFNRRKVELPL